MNGPHITIVDDDEAVRHSLQALLEAAGFSVAIFESGEDFLAAGAETACVILDLHLPGLDGGQVRSADYAGRPYIVNFWASWCVPCREEAPYLQAFAERWAGEVELVGIVWNDEEDAARAFRDEFGLTYPQATDPEKRASLSFGVRGIPETYIISADGTVMAALLGAVGPRTLDDVVAEVLGGEQVTRSNDRYRSTP